MKIHADVINALKNLDFLKEERATNLPIIQLKTVKDAEKNINGDFSVYLCKNHGDIYKHWNSLAISAKEEIIPQIEERLDNLIADSKLLESMKDQIKFDIVGLAIYLTIKKEIPQAESPFFDELYALYQSGYVPCGYAKGCYKVF